MNIYNCCSLCLEEDKNNGDNLIWLEGLQLCEDCYNRFRESDYNARIMPLNAIKKYRRKIADILEEQDKNEYTYKEIVDYGKNKYFDNTH